MKKMKRMKIKNKIKYLLFQIIKQNKVKLDNLDNLYLNKKKLNGNWA